MLKYKIGIILILLLITGVVNAIENYLSTDQFVAETFGANVPEMQTLWLNKEDLKQADKILGHAPAQFRQRYWKSADTTAWVLEEIGKEELITAGFVLKAGKILQVRILTYRESRGWEVRYPVFLKQYQGLALQSDTYLSRNIDGISGATLSVKAVSRMARLALYYEQLSIKN